MTTKNFVRRLAANAKLGGPTTSAGAIVPGSAAAGQIADVLVKRAMYVFGSPASTTLAAAATDRLVRTYLKIPLPTKRWRLRLRNWLPYTAAKGTADLSATALYVGEAALSTIGVRTGGFKSAPVAAVPAAALGSAGDQYVSAWVEDAALQFQANTLYMLSQGYTCSGGTAGSAVGGVGVLYALAQAGAAAQAGTTGVPAGMGLVSTISYLDAQIEYEFETRGKNPTPVFLTITDSTGVAVTNTANPIFADQAWPHLAALRLKCPFIAGGMSGYTTGNFTDPANGLFSRLNLSATSFSDRIVPDAAIVDIGINDLAANQSPSNILVNYQSIVANIRSFGASRVSIGTPKPRTNTGVTGYFGRVTLINPIAIGDTSITTSGNICPDTGASRFITADPGLAATEALTASAASVVSGANYTTAIAAATKAHAAGSIVVSTGEANRQSLMASIRQISNADSVIEFDRAVRDPSATYQYLGELTWDFLHPSLAGTVVIAGQIS